MGKPETYSIRVIPAASLSPPQMKDISRLQTESLMSDFPRIPSEKRAMFVRESEVTRKRPNQAVGGRNIQDRQRFTRPVAVLAINSRQDLVAQVPAANNASKPDRESLPKMPAVAVKVVETVIMEAKLHLPVGGLGGKRFIDSRYLWFGYAALGREARDNIQQTDETGMTIVDRLLMGGMQSRRAEQPISIFPFEAEDDWKSGLRKTGLFPDPSYIGRVAYPFGDEFGVGLEHWSGMTVDAMGARLLQK